MRRTPSLVDLIRGRRGAAQRDADEPRAERPRGRGRDADDASARGRGLSEDDGPRERRAGEPVQRELDLFAADRRGRGASRAGDVDSEADDDDERDDADEVDAEREPPARGAVGARAPERRRAGRVAARDDDEDADEDDAEPPSRRAGAIRRGAAEPRDPAPRRGRDDDDALRAARAVVREASSLHGDLDDLDPRARRRAAARAQARVESVAEAAIAAEVDEDEPIPARRRAAIERQRRAREDAVGEGDPEGLLAAAAAARSKRRAKPERAADAEPRMADALAELDGELDAADTATADEADDARPPRRRRAAARPIERDAEVEPDAAVEAAKPKRKRARRAALTDDAAAAAAARGAGFVTRGVQAGLAGLHRSRAVGAWGAAALSACVLVAALSWQASQALPTPSAVRGLHIVFADGPALPADDVREWIRRGFAQRAKLIDPDAETLTRLADYLRSLGAVRDVQRVRVVHEPAEDGTLDRVLEIALALREPYMPAMLADGERHWIDAEGRVLPGILPAPATARPIVRGLEVGGPHAIAEALALWRELEPQVDAGLISEIHLFDELDLKDQRGIVLTTRQGGRLIWGRPGEDEFGVERARKVRDLVHTIRCQGDLSRIAVINVRFGQPFFVMR